MLLKFQTLWPVYYPYNKKSVLGYQQRDDYCNDHYLANNSHMIHFVVTWANVWRICYLFTQNGNVLKITMFPVTH